MADFTTSKVGLGSVYPENVTETPWQELEPILTPELLIQRHLWGIPLLSRFKDPDTGKPFVIKPEMLKDEIKRAIARMELKLHMDIMPRQHSEKLPFDRNEYEALGYFRLAHRPITRLMDLNVVPANNVSIYDVPLDWVETAYLARGQINIVPLNIAVQNGGFIPSQSAGGAVFLAILAQTFFIPAFWQCDYCTGWEDSSVPRVINELIGVSAAIEVLSKLAATYALSTSHSLSLDGGSQSMSTPGPQLFKTRIEELEAEMATIVQTMKTIFGMTLFAGTL